ncbi:MAG: orotate phosphoribosyltransferase, partial [Saprospiraceae bacterium]|nr:orotate phosphoribosyltransferase [Saprospiraceae bacterium]
MNEKLLHNLSANIAKKLLEIDAVKLRPEEPFQWASGILSPIYCDNRKTLSYPHIRNEIAQAFAETAKDYMPFDTIAGVATGGIAHGALVADRLEMPFIYVRSGKKKYGTGQQVEGE